MNLSRSSAIAMALLSVTALLVVAVVVGVEPKDLPAPRKVEPSPRAEVRGEMRSSRPERERPEPTPTPTPEPAHEEPAEPAPADDEPDAATPPEFLSPTADPEEAAPPAAEPEEVASLEAVPEAAPPATGGTPAGDGEPEAGPPPRGVAAPSAQAAVTRYYAALNERRFAAAWRTLSEAVRTAFGPFERWRDGYATTLESRPSAIRVSPAPGGATVEHVLSAVDRLPCGSEVRQRFAVTWRLVHVDGTWLAERLAAVKRSGPDPAAACT